jgi:hypothetical protein
MVLMIAGKRIWATDLQEGNNQVDCGEGNFDQDDTTARALNLTSAWPAMLLSSSTYDAYSISTSEIPL